jgi:hypothetical protein
MQEPDRPGDRESYMGIRTLLKRIEQAEKALKAQSVFSVDCICFPENEPPFFCFPSEEEIAAKVKCPLHGNRFRQTTFHIYVAKWRREGEKKRRQRLSSQYRKAWLAAFPEGDGEGAEDLPWK